MSPKESWFSFLLGFIFTSAILLALYAIGTFQAVASLTEVFPQASIETALGFGALHAFVKAYIEESVFRDALPKAGLGDIISNVLFGMFHLAVLTTVGGLTYLQALLPITILIILGLVWAGVRNIYGIMGSTGSHFAWNLFAYGALPRIFMGGIA